MKFTFWLDATKADEDELIDQIEILKQQRLFAKTIRDGIRLICDLRAGQVDVLFELFPWVEDGGEFALDALRQWRICQQGVTEFRTGRAFVFCQILKGDKIGADKPISGTDVYRIVRATAALSGIEFKPHDLRRTFITEALVTGTPLATVQAAAGHARSETALRYAQAVDARRARRELKLRYG